MTVHKIPNEIEKKILEYGKIIDAFKSGKINKNKMRAYRVPMGVYEQRQDDSYMMRIRIPGGNISLSQFEELINIAQKYTEKDIHLTTRTEIQLHNIQLIETYPIMKELAKINLFTLGGGGNTIRNIIGSWNSGLSREEVFDITPYVVALTERMIQEKDSFDLPRKLKIAFSNGADDSGVATVNDLGFIAKINEKGERGFKVFIAGGMGANLNIGIKLFDFVLDNEVYNIAKATKNFFDKYGNRKNKYRARVRYILYKLGKEEFITKFIKEYEAVKEKKYPELKVQKIDNDRIEYVEIPIFLGDLSFEKAKKIIFIAKKYKTASLRLSPRQNLIIKNIPENEIQNLKKELLENNLIENKDMVLFNNALSCAGASTCRLGICLSKNLLKALKNKIEKRKTKFNNLDKIKINISGCPNSCGQHYLADIGFFGKAKKIKGEFAPFYHVVAGAILTEEESKFAENFGSIPSKNIPDFLEEYLSWVDKHKTKDEKFSSFFLTKGRVKILELVKKYESIPKSRQNDYYYDWFENKKFSILDKIEGECSAGLFDLIEHDFKNAEENLKIKNYKKAIEYIAQSLLITKGITTTTPIESVVMFKTHFVGKHLDNKFSMILDKYLTQNGKFAVSEVSELYEAVKKLYNQMDNSLRFPDFKLEVPISKKKEEDDFLIKDLKGVPCPLNFVKAKLILENLETGAKLKIVIDDGEPIANVPASLKSEGHKILETKMIDGYWEVLIEKG